MHIPFTPSEGSSLGVEWELQLVDPRTRELTSGAVEILEDIRPPDADEHPKAKHELLQSTIEVITGVCGTVAEAHADLAETVRVVSRAAEHQGLALMCAGTHPISNWATQDISPKPRYQQLVAHLQWLARRLQIFGVHVHVGVRSPDKAIPIVNALTAYVPHFLALSASSPFWVGHDTGLASSRSKVFESLPTAGLPYQLSGWDQFESYMETLVSSQTIESVREVWWDIRPHPDFGTVELRICDGLPTLDEVAVIAALAQCLVQRLDDDLDRGHTPQSSHDWVVRENKWRAARYGLDAEIIMDDHGTVVPARQALFDLADELMPVARRLSCADELAGIDRILAIGASYQRQRAIAEASGGDLTKVVDSLLEEMATGLTA
ncbi:carboxylate-amine ligase [Haloactinopolyspora alba]|uniref:Putative glutamate--cysteine ligase 2 n=1 Tax=Haloactinopolyspora alba TaxID=648780 RepID=A0A2P8DPF8_9ACTN|nr:glutamate--cysteine ligase [Haloactinopolyspora alba]PSK99104.1 carboxylate-amine ligase [Haloactinopolyspora alba]